MSSEVHLPVLVAPLIAALDPTRPLKLHDATVGAGGHAAAFLSHLHPASILLGTDRDGEILKLAAARLEAFGERVLLAKATFDQGAEALRRAGLSALDFILADLGVSSLQLDRAVRGFSFRIDGPLDMRMDPSRGATAVELLETLSEEELARIFHEYGEEPDARRLATRIVELRRRRVPRTTLELARFIESLRPMRPSGRSKIHPATRVFQALRIAVNDELGQIERALPRWLHSLAEGGRLAVISFHSLEDRLVKNAFRDAAKAGGFELCTDGPIEAEDAEVAANPRARSARLRIIERRRADHG